MAGPERVVVGGGVAAGAPDPRLASDPQFLERAAHVMANPDAFPIPPREGPARSELLEALAAKETAVA